MASRALAALTCTRTFFPFIRSTRGLEIRNKSHKLMKQASHIVVRVLYTIFLLLKYINIHIKRASSYFSHTNIQIILRQRLTWKCLSNLPVNSCFNLVSKYGKQCRPRSDCSSAVGELCLNGLCWRLTFTVLLHWYFTAHSTLLRSFQASQLTNSHCSWAGLDLLSG